MVLSKLSQPPEVIQTLTNDTSNAKVNHRLRIHIPQAIVSEHQCEVKRLHVSVNPSQCVTRKAKSPSIIFTQIVQKLLETILLHEEKPSRNLLCLQMVAKINKIKSNTASLC